MHHGGGQGGTGRFDASVPDSACHAKAAPPIGTRGANPCGQIGNRRVFKGMDGAARED